VTPAARKSEATRPPAADSGGSTQQTRRSIVKIKVVMSRDVQVARPADPIQEVASCRRATRRRV
jgi:hypothetical protein